MKSSKRKITLDDDLIELLSHRTSVSYEVIHTIIYYYQRMVLHKIKHNEDVILDGFIKFVHLKDGLYIELTEKAKKIIKR
jgi:predicted membrane-bound spermidine synthase